MKEIALILDESGSMLTIGKNTVIKSINDFIDKQRKELLLTKIKKNKKIIIMDKKIKAIKPKILVTLTTFSDEPKVIYSGIALETVKELTEKDYNPDGMTALHDAIGRTIKRLEEREPEQAAIVIQTDGFENSSREFTKTQIREMIQEKEKKGWLFIWLGAGMDIAIRGADLGITSDSLYAYTNTDKGYTQGITAAGITCSTYFNGSAISKYNSDTTIINEISPSVVSCLPPITRGEDEEN